MKLEVTFSEKEQSFQPSYEKVIAVDTGPTAVRGLLEGAVAGAYEDQQLTALRMGAFAQCEALTQVSLPNCTHFGASRQFYECKNISHLDLPRLTHMDDATYSFYGMSSLKALSLPELTTIVTGFSGTFWGCEAIERIELPKLGGTTIQSYAFRNCRNLHTLVLGGDTLNPLANANAFNNTGNAAGVTLDIYVPDHLVEAYKEAANWSTLTEKIKPISAMEEL